MKHTIMTATATMAFLAGTSLPVLSASAMQPDRSGERATQPARQPARTGDPQTRRTPTAAGEKQTRNSFYKSSDLIGSTIQNQSGEDIGEVKDLIVDRGSGQIRYVVLANGGFLGIGDKEVAISYSKTGFDHTKGQFSLNYTQEKIDSSEAFKPGEWVELESESWDEQFFDMFRRDASETANNNRSSDMSKFNNASKVEITGTVRSIDRDRGIDGDEQVTATIEQDGRMRTVEMGPSWYVMSQAKVPTRGDQITVTGFTLNESGQDRVVARNVSIDGQNFALREADGNPRWSTYSGASDRAVSPLILLSDITGMDVMAHGEDSGDIDGAVIEVNSGRIGMLILDPDENLLGMGDTLRCVPWPVVAIGPDAVRIDSDKEMLVKSQEVPEDVSVFDNRTRLDNLYRGFKLDPNKAMKPWGSEHNRDQTRGNNQGG